MDNLAENTASEPGTPLALIAAVASVEPGNESGRGLLIGHLSRARTTVFLLTATLPLLPAPTSAQGSGPGFLFKQPGVQVAFHGGYAGAPAGGDVLNRALDDFTLSKRDFDASSWGPEVAFRWSERLDIALDVRFSRSQTGSQSRPSESHFGVDLDGLPILQTTTLSRVPVTVSAKFYLRDRGRAVSQFAWIPDKWAPFVGVGGGLQWYEFKQEGDFVEETSLEILNLTLKSNGTAPTGHIFAGVDVSISPRFLWTLEGRYARGGAEAGPAFNFDNLDLSGFQATIGLAARF